MRSSFLPKCQPKFLRISALPSDKLANQEPLTASTDMVVRLFDMRQKAQYIFGLF